MALIHTVCASKYDVPTQNALKLVAFRSVMMAGNADATITESIDTIIPQRHIIKIDNLNLKDLLGARTGVAAVVCTV
jgi:hypothetical protein